MRPTQIVEAALFASQSPLTPGELARADDALTVEEVERALVALREEYERQDRAFQVYNLGDGYQILTRPEYAPYLERFDSVPRAPGLSGAALETLAIIAYRQPISRVEVEDIRGVGSSTVLRTLQEWELVRVVGRGEGLGRPLLYGTTARLLEHFGLRDLSDLPRLEDLPVTLAVEETLEIPLDHPLDEESSVAETEPRATEPVVAEEDEAASASESEPARGLEPDAEAEGASPTEPAGASEPLAEAEAEPLPATEPAEEAQQPASV